jgi:acyl-coenzyme A synthetase/AMP-(fatty) acid ligase
VLIAFLEDTAVPTGDYVSLKGERYLFAGRKDSIINVAGEKVNLLEVEEIILRFKSVQDCRTYKKNNVLTGCLVGLEVVVHDKNLFYRELEAAFINLPASYKPRLIGFKSNIALASTGKKVRVSE